MDPNSTVTHVPHPHLPWYSVVVSSPHYQRAAPSCTCPQPRCVTMCMLLLAAELCTAIGCRAHADVLTALHAGNSHASPHWWQAGWCRCVMCRATPHAACWSTCNDDGTTAAAAGSSCVSDTPTNSAPVVAACSQACLGHTRRCVACYNRSRVPPSAGLLLHSHSDIGAPPRSTHPHTTHGYAQGCIGNRDAAQQLPFSPSQGKTIHDKAGMVYFIVLVPRCRGNGHRCSSYCTDTFAQFTPGSMEWRIG
jgi:hypothetical protein